MAEGNRCPECGMSLSPEATPGQLCPRCLLSLGLDPETEKTGNTPPVDPLEDLESTEIAGGEGAQSGRVGPYRILQKLGEGGMGEVFEAEQLEPVRRKVALKLIKWGMDTRRVVARFEAERQALALMNHRSIARVYEAGSTEQGRPYFAMELVKGVPITDYCDRHLLSTRDRLDLFMQVCDGIQHAHHKGIIHRDIKPSNVLVAIEDDKPVPKIIDFGVAKATEQRLTEKTVFTELGQLVGTPEYMSPEQAEMTGLDIDTRTDVYSLGVLLYQLLSGALPFESAELRRAGYDEIRRRIREDEPSKPSTRLSSLGEGATEAAKNRSTDPGSLVRRLRGDLDWISMKALEKDRTRRYGSPQELAADVARHLQSEPVLAGPPSAAYKAKKFVRRHRIGVTAAGIVLAALVLGVVGTTFGMLRALAAEGQAREEARRAEASHLFSLGRGLIEENPSAALAYAIASLELADNPVVRDLAMQVIANGPTAFSEKVDGTPVRMNFSPDGDWLAAGGWHGLHRLWNVDGSPSRAPSGHGDDVTVRVGFSHDSKLHISGNDNDVRVWRLPELTQVRRFDPDGDVLSLRSAVVGAGGRLFQRKPLGGERYRLSWLPIMDGEAEELSVWQGREVSSNDGRLGVDRDGAWFVYIDGPGLFALPLEALESATPRQIGLGDEELYFFRFHPDGKQVVTVDWGSDLTSSSEDPVLYSRIQFWSLPDGSAEPLRSIQAHRPWGQYLGFDDRGRWLATLDNTEQGASVRDLQAPPGTPPLVLRRGEVINAGLAVHPAGTWIAVGDADTVSIWPLGGSHTRVLTRQEGQNNQFSGVVFDPHGEWLVSASNNGEIRLWPLAPDGGESGRVLWDDPGNGLIGALSVAPNGEYVVADRWWGGILVLPVSGGEPRILRGFRGVNATAVDADSRRVAAAGGERYAKEAHVRIWDLESGEQQVLDAGDGKLIWGLEFTADGRLLSSGKFGIRLWSLDTGESDLLLEGAAYGTLSPDGRSCFGVRAADPEDPEGPAIAFVLDVEQRVIRDLPWPDLRIRGTTTLGHGLRPLSWDPSGEKIVFQDRRGVIQVASIGGDEPHRLVGHEGPSVLAVHPDGRLIASGGADGTLRMWPMPEGRPRHTLAREEFLDKLRSFTNHRVVADEESIAGYRVEFGRLPGWGEVPSW